MSVDFLAIGETMLQVSPHGGQQLALGSTFGISPGGAESNVAILLAQLGWRSVWLSGVGADAIGRLVEEGVAAAGVDTSMVESIPGHPTGIYFKQPQGVSTSVVYYRSGSAATTLDRAALAKSRDLSPRVVFTSGILPALSDSCADLSRAVIVDAFFDDAAVVFDVNYRPALWSGRSEAAAVLHELASAASVVFVGRDEAQALWDTRTAEDIRALLPAVGWLVVKDGEMEAVEFSGDAVVRVATPAVSVVDIVGAGDAFAAGWLAGKGAGGDAVVRLRAGHATAAAVIASATDQPADITSLRATLADILGVPLLSAGSASVDVHSERAGR